MRLNTGTKISLLFSIFNFIIIFLFILFINIYTNINWYINEKKEILWRLDQQYDEVLEKETVEAQKEKLITELEEKWWFIWENKKYKKKIYDIYRIWSNKYLIFYKNTKFWKITIPYDVSDYIKNQVFLLHISLLWLLFFSILSFFISKFLFIRFALKDIFDITNKLRNIDLENIKKINIPLKKGDEIYEIINSINKFLTLIEENTKNLKEFNTMVSHEFKTPLMVISSQIEYAVKTKDYEKSFLKIERQIDLLNELLETFLFISKIQNSKVNINQKEVNISNIVENLIQEFEEIYASKNLKIIKNIKPKILLKTDEKLFLLVIKNLIDNSFKYTNNSWKIEIDVSENSFKIKDNWIWISEDKLYNIFDSFYRESNDDKWYWIGLNIVKKIIDILKYSIHIKTEKWKGSEFLINF